MLGAFEERRIFGEELNRHLSPTRPVESEEHLFGRTRQTGQIEQALYAPGRSIFVYGDRGVGKTSLARTVARMHQSAFRDPVMVACEPETTFSSVMAAIVEGVKDSDKDDTVKTTKTAKIGMSMPTTLGGSIELSHAREMHRSVRPSTIDLNEAVTALLRAGKSRKEDTVAVIDEFDRIASDVERTHFADFIKQIGDRGIPIRFIFCGVADSLQKLLGAHGSCYRYLEGVEVPRLSYEGRWEIIDRTAAALGVVVDERPRMRIAAMSDGFPYYVHLVCEKLFWEMFNDPVVVGRTTPAHYHAAVAQAVLGIQEYLAATYQQAVMKEAVGYEEVLWAMADHADPERKTEDIFQSYEKLFGDAPEKIDRNTVVARLRALKGASSGHILTSARKGYYRFTESMMRGYVRLRAEAEEVELASELASTGTSNRALSWGQRGARPSRRGARPLDWRKTNIPMKDE